tara:strand:+ start:48777 stop:49799 length:1023 start_codon:yes stop_codon:yes gene_type:complete
MLNQEFVNWQSINLKAPWDLEGNSNTLFPLNNYFKLLDRLYISREELVDQYNIFKGYIVSDKIINQQLTNNWLWGFYLPFFANLTKYLKTESKPLIFGISGLPGSGKSSLGRKIEQISKYLDLTINVISMDDFYLPANDMEKAIQDNPWNVPRGIPGSHSIDEMNTTLKNYSKTGVLSAPTFDKSLRNGLGDRSGSIKTSPKVLILEGWFLGCIPIENIEGEDLLANKIYDPPLSSSEISFRNKIQDSLIEYVPIWNYFNKIWHIKAEHFSYTSSWKVEQEMNMQLKRGSSLKGDQLKSFIRMINTAIPQESLQNINSDFVIIINKMREIIYSGINKDHL